MLRYLFLITLPLFLHAEIEVLRPLIVSVIPHDTSAFTQGLKISDGILYESTGLYGQSSLRKIDLHTGEIKLWVKLPKFVFAEGLAIINNQIILSTWKEKKAFVFDKKNLKFLRIVPYKGDAWGLCLDQKELIMTNGSSTLLKRDPTNLNVISHDEVLHGSQKITYLNDIESVGNSFYINIWKKDTIIRINKDDGQLTGVIDASQLLTPEEKHQVGQDGVLNGIAYNPETKTFFITGKFWPKIFEVKFLSETQ